MGYLSDVYGRERVNTLGIIIAGRGHLLPDARRQRADGILPLMFALLFGLGYGAAAPLLPSVCADIFLGNSFGLIFAVIAIGGGAGGAAGALHGRASAGHFRHLRHAADRLHRLSSRWPAC
jgi:MFS family permease